MQPPVPELGEALKQSRKGRRLTLEQLAERSGVSKSMLSQIERGKVNPTFAVLWNLSSALGVEISDLISGASEAVNSDVVEHMKVYSTPEIKSQDGKCLLRILNPARSALNMEWYELVYEPGGELDSDAHADGTWEHLTVLDGVLQVHVAGRVFTVEAGETLRYDVGQPHRISNASGAPARALLVVALPGQYSGPRPGAA